MAVLQWDGLIPAGAGKTVVIRMPETVCEAHPRGGGENFLAVCTCGWRDGSSPRGRGKRSGVDPKEASDGLIPAGAGKTGS